MGHHSNRNGGTKLLMIAPCEGFQLIKKALGISRLKEGKNKSKEKKEMEKNEELKVTAGAIQAAAEQCPTAKAVLAALFPGVINPEGLVIWREGLTEDALYVRLTYSNRTPGAVKVVLVNKEGAKVANLAVIGRNGVRACELDNDEFETDDNGRLKVLSNS